jgi:hypothetical protein
MNLETLIKEVEEAKSGLIRRRANLQSLTALTEGEKQDCETYKKEVETLTDSVAVLQNFSNGIRTDIITKFEDLITSGVREVFNKDYKVAIEFSTSGNSYHAEFYVFLPDGKKINLMAGEGGGLRDFISVLQRMLYIILEPTKPSRLIFLDENLKHLDSSRAATAFKFISGLAKELDIQILMITHSAAAIGLATAGMATVVEIGHDGQQVYAKKVDGDKL